jgi:hypothetical protein
MVPINPTVEVLFVFLHLKKTLQQLAFCRKFLRDLFSIKEEYDLDLFVNILNYPTLIHLKNCERNYHYY